MKPLLRAASALLMVAGLLVTSAHAQLTSYVDERGNLVYTNDSAPRASAAKGAKPSATVKPAVSTNAAPRATLASFTPTTMSTDDLRQIVLQSAEKHNVDPALVSAVIKTESNWNSSAISRKGAQGLMQLVPETAQRLGVGNAFDPAENVDAGTRYLRMLLERYNGDLTKALAAYNAGPGVVDRFGGVPNYRETRDYVRRVTSTYFQPGSAQTPFEHKSVRQIYRTTAADGRVVFTNE